MLNVLTYKPGYLLIVSEYVTQVGMSEREALSPGCLPREPKFPQHLALLVD
jgi:hypothetical protein